MELHDRMKQQMDVLNLKAVQLTKKTGASKGSISQWVNGVSKPSGQNLIILAKALQCDAEWLLEGKGNPEDSSNVIHEPKVNKRIPVVSWTKAGEYCEGYTLEPSEVDLWLPIPSNCSDGTFALRVEGDSMTAQHLGERSYPQGIYIFVDPEKEIYLGCKVVAGVVNNHTGKLETTFKTYTQNDGIFYLSPINTRYPVREVDHTIKICGIVIGSHWPE